MKKTSFSPALETMENRAMLSTLTVVNDTSHTIYVQYVIHHPALSGQTGWSIPEPGFTEWSGSYQVKSGTARDFSPGDSRPDIRVSSGGKSYFLLSGSGIQSHGSRYATLTAGYDLQRTDGNSNLSVTIGNRHYGSRSPGSLQSLGVTVLSGFYTVPNDETLRISGPRKITGTETFGFSDYSGVYDTDNISHSWSTPHGTTITGYSVHLDSNRGDNISFYKFGNTLVESGQISGSGFRFGGTYGGSYVGTVQVNYAYP